MPKPSTLGLTREDSGTYRLRLPKALLAQWTVYAKAHQDTAAEALRSLMRHLLKGAPTPATMSGAFVPPPARTVNLHKIDHAPKKRIELRLTENEYAVLAQIAEERESSIQWWLVSLVRAALTGGAAVGGAELKALSDSNYQLSAIGRNLNQIAKQLNADPSKAHRLQVEQIEALARRIEANRAATHAVIATSSERWELR